MSTMIMSLTSASLAFAASPYAAVFTVGFVPAVKAFCVTSARVPFPGAFFVAFTYLLFANAVTIPSTSVFPAAKVTFSRAFVPS